MQIIKPNFGQESVWDYPRPPKLEQTNKQIKIYFNEALIADTTRAWRVLETSHPPVYYLPPEDILMENLVSARGGSWCEWKGQAVYFDVVNGKKKANKAAWTYARPTASFAAIKNHVAFYAGLMDRCLVNGEEVIPQSGGFYGGWITNDIVGPFKGAAGTSGW